MKSSFVILRTECCNPDMDTPCRILLQGVINGELQEQQSFFINPGDGDFYYTMTALQLDTLRDFPLFPDVWVDIEKEIRKYPLVVAPADGYSMHVLYNTFNLYSMNVEPIQYVTAKNICRKGFNTIMYTTAWLAMSVFHEEYEEFDIFGIDKLWARLINKAVEDAAEDNLISWCNNHDIIIGHFNQDDFDKCTIRKHYFNKYVPATAENLGVEVHADPNNPFCGAAVVFTGKLESFLRKDAQRMVLEVGGECPNGVSAKVNYLVVGLQDIRVVGPEGLSGKMKKAAELHEKGADIEIISENDFLSMINV